MNDRASLSTWAGESRRTPAADDPGGGDADGAVVGTVTDTIPAATDRHADSTISADAGSATDDQRTAY